MYDEDSLTPDALSAGLKTGCIGRKIIYFPETDSTNTRALAAARDGAPEGTVILADRQTAGRGRMNREWHSPGGAGIYLSILLNSRISLNRLPGITLVAAVAAAEALQSAARIRVDIKWPNDLLLNKKKICGILTELHSLNDGTTVVIVGIGINVNTPVKLFPDELRNIASSIMIETGKGTSRIGIVTALLEHFDHWHRIFTDGSFETILERWKSFSGIIGRKIRVEREGAQTIGTAVDIDMSGALIVKDDSGTKHIIYSGDVSYI